ncbi:MAG: tol-pal system protein YbgF [Acidobacteriia bacterium]|nr:tol-pal system protein YbgF [Terriglobia bacterium]
MRGPARHSLCLATTVAVALAAAACVMPDQVARLEKDMADVRQDLLKIQKEQGEARDRLTGVEGRIAGQDPVKRPEFADLRVRLDELARQQSALDERVKETNRRVDHLSSDVQASRELARRAAGASPVAPAGTGPEAGAAPAPAPGAPPVEPVPDPQSLYNTAYADFSKGNFVLAVSGFQEYATRFPESDLADNALYWVGECLFSQGKFAEAVQAFDRMLDKYPQGDRAAAANLKKGLAFLEQNQIAQAIVQLRYVVTTYPSSDEARIARDKLSSLGATK